MEMMDDDKALRNAIRLWLLSKSVNDNYYTAAVLAS